MSTVEGYIFRIALGAFLAGLFALTGVIWVTQALRQVDLLTTKGQTLLIFFGITGLTLPSLVTIISPVALFVAVLYALNRLNGDSELVVMSASGLSPLRLLRPFALLTLAVALLVGFMSLWAMPASFRSIRDLAMSIQTDFLTRVVREGQFSELVPGFFFHYRERGPDGSLQGIFIQDRRDPARINTYIAETGATVEQNGLNYLVLEKGSVQRQTKDSRDPAMVVFESYAIDLAQFGSSAQGAPLKPRERSTASLLSPDPKDKYFNDNRGAMRSELNDRFAAPLWAIVLGLVGFAAMAQPRTTRQSRGTAIAGAVIAVLALRIGGFWASTLATRHAWGVLFMFGVPLIGMGFALLHTFVVPLPEAAARLAAGFAIPRPRLKSA